MLLHSNAILASLSASDTAALRPHLKASHLPQKTVLYETGDAIKAVYFPINAVVSLVVSLASGEMTEAAMVGRDGAVSTVHLQSELLVSCLNEYGTSL